MDETTTVQGREITRDDIELVRRLIEPIHPGIAPGFPKSYAFCGTGVPPMAKLKIWPAAAFF